MLSGLNLPSSPPQKIITCVVEGALEVEDLEAAALPPARANASPGAEASPSASIKKIREKHHSAARLISSGLSQRMAAQLVGYDEAYLSTLLKSPAMEELVGFYRAKYSNSYDVITERLRSAGMGALAELEEKLDSGQMETSELLALAKLGLDRAGHGPAIKQHNINEEHIIDHAELKRLNKEAQRGSSRFIEDGGGGDGGYAPEGAKLLPQPAPSGEAA